MSPRTAWHAFSERCRRSTSQPSTAPKRAVSNSRPSRSARSWAPACRNRANSPCGSSTTWQNCSRFIPSSCWTSAPISWCDLLLARQPPLPPSVGDHSRSRVCARSGVEPEPRFFGRSCSGIRVISSRRPPRVTSSTTSVLTSGLAWSLRSLVRGRAPGTIP